MMKRRSPGPVENGVFSFKLRQFYYRIVLDRCQRSELRTGVMKNIFFILHLLLVSVAVVRCTGFDPTELLIAHNTYRCMWVLQNSSVKYICLLSHNLQNQFVLCVSYRHSAPLLTWDCDVAASAQSWADKGSNLHSDSYHILPPAGPAGENLGFGQTTGKQVTADWYNEISSWQSSPKNGSGNFESFGHFTALIWKGGSKLGCGFNTTSKFWVCRYKADDTLNSNTPNYEG